MWKGSAFSRATISIPNAVSKFTAVVFVKNVMVKAAILEVAK
jgi:hypothetical protein